MDMRIKVSGATVDGFVKIIGRKYSITEDNAVETNVVGKHNLSIKTP